MNLLGIDPSLSNTGLALIEYKNNNIDILKLYSIKCLKPTYTYTKNKVKFKKHYSMVYRLNNFNEKFIKFLDSISFDVCVIEEPVVFHNSKGVINQSYLIGNIINIICNYIPVYNTDLINNTTMKKIVYKGNAKKEDIKNSLQKKFKDYDLYEYDNDIIDALGIAYSYTIIK